MKKMGIYKITNLKTNKCYIGRSSNLERRRKDHFRLFSTKGHKEYNKALYKSMRKHGKENFIFEVIEYLDDYSLAPNKEQYWIKYFDSYHSGYNEDEGGVGGSVKGHCSGVNNGRALLTEKEIVEIRTDFLNGLTRKESYKKFKNKISNSAFGKIWQGKSYSNIMPEVYTKENILRNLKKGKGQSAKQGRKLTKKDVVFIRQKKKEGVSLNKIYDKYFKLKCSKSCVSDVFYYKTFKDEVV